MAVCRTMLPMPVWHTDFRPALFARGAALGFVRPLAPRRVLGLEIAEGLLVGVLGTGIGVALGLAVVSWVTSG